MQSILEAIYKNGAFVLDHRLGIEKEGKKFKVIIIEEEKAKAKKDRFFQFVEKFSFNLPGGYKFNREEIHER